MKTVIGVVILATILLRLFCNMFSFLPVNDHNTRSDNKVRELATMC
jgi:hypothetical protein